MERYRRQIQLEEVGTQGQLALSEASVLVVGAGGLGSPILQYLAAAGLGKLGIADADTVSLSNLHRQLLYTTDDVGRPKVEAAQQRLKAINPEVETQTYSEGIHADNATTVIEQYDLIVDATDNFQARYLINDVCVALDKPWIFGALYKNEGQFALFNYQHGPSYRCLYPQPPKVGEVPSCVEIGVLGTVSGIIGMQMAQLAMQFFLWPNELPNTFVFFMNMKDFSLRKMQLRRTFDAHQKEKDITTVDTAALPHLRPQELTPNISIDQLPDYQGADFLDVRELDELPEVPEVPIHRIPLNQLSGRFDELDRAQTYIVFCQGGQRARNAVDLMRSQGFEHAYVLEASAAVLKRKIENSK
jgi:adenylyltransferase/sulfurtransferase